jgi:hypothetical protein
MARVFRHPESLLNLVVFFRRPLAYIFITVARVKSHGFNGVAICIN